MKLSSYSQILERVLLPINDALNLIIQLAGLNNNENMSV